jgi:hypothetical protein
VKCSQSGIARLDDFVAIYHDNMDRVRAPARYYFGKSYLECLLSDAPGMAHLFICEDEGRPIGGGIFTLCNGIVQWHLCGTVRDYDGPPPAKLLLDVARRWARDAGAHTLHLGGGVGGNRDSLYCFKRGFTDREHAFATWRCVANDDVYMQLTNRACRHSASLDDFFPAYRRPVISEPSVASAGGDSRGRSR